MKVSLADEMGTPMDAMLFTDGYTFLEELGSRRVIDVIYYPTVNEYNGSRTLQVIIKNYKIPV